VDNHNNEACTSAVTSLLDLLLLVLLLLLLKGEMVLALALAFVGLLAMRSLHYFVSF
jgi:hypothetical protein